MDVSIDEGIVKGILMFLKQRTEIYLAPAKEYKEKIGKIKLVDLFFAIWFILISIRFSFFVLFGKTLVNGISL